MADFDGGGFAAVDAFYGTKEEEDSSKTKGTVVPASTASSHSRLRGVGATIPSQSNNATTFSSDTLKTNLRKFGTSKRTRFQDEEPEGNGDELEDDEDEDEEQGRTAIDTKSPAHIALDNAPAKDVQKRSKTKKLKKEQQTVGQGKNDNQIKGVSLEKGLEKSIDNNLEELNRNEPSQLQVENGKKPRKRRKVRSRQKNIYKDHRDVKPVHLQPGGSSYRPLTPATKSKIGTPKIRKMKSDFD
jgi:hypothetical protein